MINCLRALPGSLLLTQYLEQWQRCLAATT